jgi:hypothetical protein
MEDATERCRTLCESASSEKDPDKFIELIREIYRLLEEKRRTDKSIDNQTI